MALHLAAVRALALCAGGVFLSSCATRPDIETVAGVNAFRVAQAIRCEMRDGIIEIIASRVSEASKLYQGAEAAKLAAEAERLRRRDFRGEYAEVEEAGRFETLLRNAKLSVDRDKAKKIPPNELASALVRYADAAIAYDFELNLRQTDNAGGSIDLLGTLTRGTITGSPGASFEGKREAIRNFRLLDTFGRLLTNRPTIQVCNQLRIKWPRLRSPNAAYPIAGNLGLERLLREFVSFNQSANLVGADQTPDVPTMAETIEFTTTVGAGVEPELKLTPLEKGLEVTGAKLNLSKERYDRHKVILTFTLPARPETVANERSETERAAVGELDRQRQLLLDSEEQRLLRLILDR